MHASSGIPAWGGNEGAPDAAPLPVRPHAERRELEQAAIGVREPDAIASPRL